MSEKFIVWDDHVKGIPGIGIQSSRLDECIDHYHANGMGGALGTPFFGFQEDNFDFLGRIPCAKWLWFWEASFKNIDGLYSLNGIQNLGIVEKRPSINFSRLPTLKTLTTYWTKKDIGVEDSRISTLKLWHYKPRSKSYESLQVPKNVTRLEINWANPSTLAGFPVLPKLKTLHIHRCSKLTDLSDLPTVAPKLQNLWTTTSKHICADDGVRNHPTLKKAQIEGHFVVGSPPW